MKTRLLLLIGIVLSSILLIKCSSDTPNATHTSPYLNVSDSVRMVGMQTCRSCHQSIYDSYIQTGMGQSFGLATRTKSAATFDNHSVVYDKKNDLYYKPFFANDTSLYILEYRLAGKDTIFRRLERVDYIIGSGHHTNSHLINRNGYIYQAPITFYTQQKRWDLAPGFEDSNSRFERIIRSECLTCHNHLPTPVPNSDNKYTQMPLGIECERCHGAGEMHVREKLAGNIVDTAAQPDYTIVNPRRLPIDLQMDICQRCHLQGIAVLNEGKTFYDFRPSMRLSDVMEVFLPRFTNSDKRFIMASQADRLRMSPCFTKSNALSCISCHNPHHAVKDTLRNPYNAACRSCHNAQTTASSLKNCIENTNLRQAANDNCVSCHMKKSGSIDIPHVHITDHYIHRSTARPADTISDTDKKEIAQFLGLQNLTTPNPSALSMARGYLALYDKFMAEPLVLDSALAYLQHIGDKNPLSVATWIHYYFIKMDYANIAQLAQSIDNQNLTDAWTAYRIGESFSQLHQLAQAQTFLERAVRLQTYNLEFQEKLSLVYAKQGNIKKGKQILEWVLSEQGDRKLAHSNLGFMYVQSNDLNKALYHYNQSLALDMDYEPAILNKAALLIQLRRLDEARALLNGLLKRQPQHERALQLLQQIR